MIGHTISHYTITDKLGQGGMGEVYRARDTKLNREVALKILPPAFARDAERMARFEREAQVLASLNHPHIAQIHGLEEADGTNALVLELVEGETLAERIARGPIPVDHALQIAVQICEGLEAAHEKRIIHRDLKPANIKITPEEQVKILDFGLAKALEGEGSAFDLANSPTLTHDGTRAGVILGTAGYMAPEQARGKAATARADIWAFGVVLYEMLTGQRAFAGDTVSDTLAKVLEREPDWDALPTSVPPRIRRLLRRCLTKDHRERLHDIGDARLELQETLAEGGEEGGAASAASRRSSSRVLLLTGGVVAGTAMGVLGAWGLWGRGAPVVPATVDHVELVTAEPTAAAISGKELAISPDGRQVVYRSLEEPRLLYLRDLSQREPTRIGEASVDEANPFFSPDGQWFGFFDRGNLKKVAVAGGTPEVLCEAPNPFGGTWGRDGTIVFAPHVNRGLWAVSEDGGEPERLTTPTKDEWGHHSPVFLQDGRSVLFAVWHGSTRYDLALLDVASRKYEVILEGVSYAVPAASGHLVFARSDGLYAVAFDPVSKRPQGREVPLLRDVFVSHHGPWGQFDLSRTGTLVYRTGRPRPSELVQVDLAGTVAPLPLPARLYHRPRYAPDGQTIAVNVWEDGDSRTYLADLQSGRLSHVASQGSADPPLWTPDGRHLIVWSDRLGKGQWESFQQPISGGEAAPFLEAEALGVHWFEPASWASNGSVVVGTGQRTRPPEGAEVSGDLMYWAKEAPTELTTLVAGRERAEMYNALLSPDGKWVVYVVNERFYGGLPSQIVITDFPEGKSKYPISQEWGYMPLWAPDGKHIYFVAEPGLMAVDIQWEPAVRVSAPRRLFGLGQLDPVQWYYPFPGYDISPDGKHLLMIRPVSDWQHPRHLNLITNFFAVLREKVPTAN